jgi:hypothetical protein
MSLAQKITSMFHLPHSSKVYSCREWLHPLESIHAKLWRENDLIRGHPVTNGVLDSAKFRAVSKIHLFSHVQLNGFLFKFLVEQIYKRKFTFEFLLFFIITTTYISGLFKEVNNVQGTTVSWLFWKFLVGN